MTKKIIIESWMVDEKRLSGNELVCYAYVWNMTNGGDVEYTGGYASIAKAIGVTAPSVYNVLGKLRERGMVQYESLSAISVMR